MTTLAAGWSWLWIFFGVFVFGQALRWGFWGGRWAKRHSRHWSWEAWEGRDSGHGRELEALRNDLDGRLAEIDSLQSRVTELENRLDFAERLLAERREQPAVGAASSPDR